MYVASKIIKSAVFSECLLITMQVLQKSKQGDVCCKRDSNLADEKDTTHFMSWKSEENQKPYIS